ncbi:hypothetical protein BH09DEP1_BH09DEP1_5130 [soil metagenome]
MFLLFLLSFISTAAMDAPPQRYVIKKYSCCPDNFGYATFPNIPTFITNREAVRLTTFEETRQCDDTHYSVKIPTEFLARLLIEVSKDQTPHAIECVRQFRLRFFEGKIKQDGPFHFIALKDLAHRLLPYLACTVDTDLEDANNKNWKIAVNNSLVEVRFDPCVHKVISLEYLYATDIEEHLFGVSTHQEFATLTQPKLVPTLLAICLNVISQNSRYDTSRLPQELRDQI